VRFEIRYANGTSHEIELEGTVATVGRDPSCDVVLNDSKCSRRHAVLEAGAQGIAIRDTGSANGVFVNGRKVERAGLGEGDVVQLGDVSLKVLDEEVPKTLMMEEEDAAALIATPTPPVFGAAAAAPRMPQAPQPGVTPAGTAPPTSSQRSGPIPRPLTITLLAVLWLVGGLVEAVGGLAWTVFGGGGLWPVAAGFLLLMVSTVMGVGIWLRRPWARALQILFAGLGVLSCVFLPACAAIVIYMLRPEVRLQFISRGDFRGIAPRDAERVLDGSSDMAFAGAILGSLLVGLVLAVAATFAVGGALGSLGR
jgi:pSer/pThr/pTyr-binding forkhead associated (FHA) protein